MDLGTIAAAVAWELVRLPDQVRADQLARIAAEAPLFHTLVVEHLATLRV
jgi:hypothetical protein